MQSYLYYDVQFAKKEGDEGDNDFIKITQLGANGVNNASRIRNDNICVNDGDDTDTKLFY